MESSISSRSLMMGNVSTEESRNEIRNSPGAPSPPANATIFAFHPFKLVANGNSSHPSASSCMGVALAPDETRWHARLLRERRAVEVIHEDLHERGPVQVRQLWNFADHANVPETFDRFAVLPVLVADQHYTMYRQFRRVQR